MLFICFRYIIKTIIFSCLIINSCFAEGFIGIKDIEKSLGIKDQDDNNYIIDDLPTSLEKNNNKFIEDDLVNGMVYDLNNVEGLESREYAKIYDVSVSTIRTWQKAEKLQLELVNKISEDKVNNFVELKVTEKINEEKKILKEVNLRKASFEFKNLNLTIEGEVKSTVVISIIKILEESCYN